MAWLASLASAGIGAGSASASAKAQKKANNNASGLDQQGYQNALANISKYQDIGGAGAVSLAELMGIKGYRTKEEQDFTEFLKTKPKLPGSVDGSFTKSEGFMGLLDKQEKYSTLGDSIGGVSSYYKKRNKKKSRKIAAAQAQSGEQYKASLAEWEAKRAGLESTSNASLVNYDPTSALKNTPGYSSRYNEGLKTANNSIAGSMLSGNALRGLTDYGQTFASNEFNNEFNRRSALAGIGQNADTTAGNWSIGQGGNAANLALQQGQNQSNMYGNMNNIAQGTISNYLNYQNRNNQNNQQNYLYGYGNSSYPQGNSDVAETYDWTK